MSEELKPVRCGCGGEAKVYVYSMDGGFWHRYNVECTKCNVRTPKYDNKDEAVKAWNKAMGTENICKNCKNYDGSYCKFDNEYSIAKDYGCNCFERRES